MKWKKYKKRNDERIKKKKNKREKARDRKWKTMKLWRIIYGSGKDEEEGTSSGSKKKQQKYLKKKNENEMKRVDEGQKLWEKNPSFIKLVA